MRVILAEHDAQAAALIRAAVEMSGCRVIAAADAAACLRHAGSGQVDLILLDLALPHPAGLDCEGVVRRIRQEHPDVPIVAMAGETSRDLEHRIRRHGIVCYLTKPVASGLIREVVDHLRRRKTEHVQPKT